MNRIIILAFSILIPLVGMPAIAQQQPMKPPAVPMPPRRAWASTSTSWGRSRTGTRSRPRASGSSARTSSGRASSGPGASTTSPRTIGYWTAWTPGGIRTLFILDYRNPLYGDPETTEEGREAYAKWAAASAGHFKGRDVVWEIWNEPNVGFWKGKGGLNSPEFADQYVALVKKTVPAMRAADPDCCILGGSVSCLWRDSFRWLDEAFKQGLLQTGINALSVHPYGFSRPELCIDPREPGAVKDGYAVLREMLAKAGAAMDFPVVNSEVGYPAEKKVTLEQQAMLFVRQYLVDQMCDVRMTIWYNWDERDAEAHKVPQPRPGAAAGLQGLQEHDAGDGRLPFRGAAQGGCRRGLRAGLRERIESPEDRRLDGAAGPRRPAGQGRRP